MDINSTTSAPSAAAAQTGATASEGMINSDFETFLKMLTAQMQNQDPLNPIESADFATQLATFSGVEQQVRTNDLLASIGAGLGDGLTQYAGWVGMEARVAAPAQFDGRPVTVLPTPEATADTAMMVVRDSTGAEVQRFEISVSDDPFTWTGLDSSGVPVADGAYSFFVESHAGGQLLSTSQAQIYALVSEVRTTAGQPSLVLDGGTEVVTSAVTALRTAP